MNRIDFDKDRERHILIAREVIRNEARALEDAAAAIGSEFVEAVETDGALLRADHRVRRRQVRAHRSEDCLDALLDGHAGVLPQRGRGDPRRSRRHSQGRHRDSPSRTAARIRSWWPCCRCSSSSRCRSSRSRTTCGRRSRSSRTSRSCRARRPQADPIGLAPTASAAAALAIGDALALAIAQHRGYTAQGFRASSRRRDRQADGVGLRAGDSPTARRRPTSSTRIGVIAQAPHGREEDDQRASERAARAERTARSARRRRCRVRRRRRTR